MKPRYAIRLPSDAYFVDSDTPNGGTRREALGFENRRAAVNYLRLFPTLAPGGVVVSLRYGTGVISHKRRAYLAKRRPPHGRRARRAQWLADAEALNRCAGFLGYAAALLRARSAARRARRLAARRTA